MKVRAATSEDCETISKIAIDTFHLACPADTPPQELEHYIQGNLTPDCFYLALNTHRQRILVVETSGRVAGFSLVNHAAEDLGIAQADSIPELTRCYVAAAYHGSGAAQYLLTETLSTAPGPIRLTVNDQNRRAIRFYQRNGFQEVGETTFRCGDDIHRDLVMVRRQQPE
ncbi:GNAT family N-acetyltransferase [Izhakiella australiensis]|uniref:GNAT family N-acetyltransferase n=1 Tax=Izhakiella australiensis TaxID=1926881 RepID=A0A1S8YBS4_9GAMM|nr:N-acetyltransferase [Izhakiella australiensis]OON36534.1 GNAT family N-acetyltransferase [Izhakiella australiensis]